MLDATHVFQHGNVSALHAPAHLISTAIEPCLAKQQVNSTTTRAGQRLPPLPSVMLTLLPHPSTATVGWKGSGTAAAPHCLCVGIQTFRIWSQTGVQQAGEAQHPPPRSCETAPPA
jgi:hypothetical protein